MADVKGKNNFLKMPQLNGVDIIPPGGTTGQQLAKLSSDDYLLQWVDVNVDGLSTAASPTSSIQFNTAGAFDGSADFTFDKTNRRLNIVGTSATTQTTIGGTAQVDSGDTNAVLYVEVDASGSGIDGFRTYFNRGSANFNGWISFDYDGATPNLRLVDEDDDSPYISFEVIGTGTDAAPQFKNTFGGAGPVAGAEDGFSWKVNGVETMYHNTSQLSFGSTDIYTTDNVFSVYIGDIPAFSMYSDGDWSVLDIHPSPTAGAFLKM